MASAGAGISAGSDIEGATDDVRTPFLTPADFRHITNVKTNFWECTFNLTKVILGAGIMALPRAVALLGWGPGISLLVAVGILTHFTVHGLVFASDRARQDTYSALVRTALGPIPERVLQAVMLLGCLGFEVVYVDIVGDLLLGEEPDRDGLITTWLPPDMRREWWVGRPFVLATLTVVVLAPLTSMRSMGHLGAINVVGLLSLVAFAGATVWLSAAAVAAGTAHELPLGPDLVALGPDTASRVTAALSVVPIVLTAASCHQSVHPLRSLLVPYSSATLDRVVALSLTMVTTLFVVVSVAAYTAFGRDVRGNFLNNLSPPQLAPLIGSTAATVVSLGIKGGYALSLVGSSVLIMFPLRQAMLEMVVPSKACPSNGHVPAPLYLSSTYCLLAMVYVIAVFVPSIWDVISFVGAVACTIMCFILPAALLLRYKGKKSVSDRLQRAAAWLVGLLGVLLFANVFVGMFLSAGRHPASPPPASGGELEGIARAWKVGGWGAGSGNGAGDGFAGAANGPGGDESTWGVWKWAGWGA